MTADPPAIPRARGVDPLTGLPDIIAARRVLADWSNANAAPGMATPLRIHAMLLSLGRFDAVNVAFGETVGDGALIETARRIAHFVIEEFGRQGLAARIGGTTFLVATTEECSRERWQLLAEALAQAIASPFGGAFAHANVRLAPRLSLMRNGPGDDGAAILDKLAEGLAQGEEGKRQIVWANESDLLPGRLRRRLEADLLSAIDREEISLVFQPQYRLRDDTLYGAEALARWQHPEFGSINTTSMFAMAERTEHVTQLSRHIAQQGLAAAKQWPRHCRLSLNITANDLAMPAFGHEMAQLIAQADIDPSRVTFELTEQALLRDMEGAINSLSLLKQMGVRLALDDFGAGFCNFRYLKMLPLDLLKLDRTMIDGITTDKRDLAVLRGIVAMAKGLDLKVLVEGVEHLEQTEIVRREGCDYVQGYYYSEPLSKTNFQALVKGG